MKRGRRVALLLWLALGGPVQGADMSWVPEGQRATGWHRVDLPGIEAWVLADEGAPRSRGVLRQGGQTLEGAQAFRAALAVADRTDPEVVAQLAALLLDRSAREVKAPFRPASGSRPVGVGASQAEAPRFEGEDVVVYWRYADDVAELVRVRVGLDGTLRGVDRARDLAAPPADVDPLVTLQTVLATGTPDAQRAAVSDFSRSGHPDVVRGLALVLQHPSPLVRRTAVDGLARIRTPEAMQPLVPVLLSDANGDVRAAAMRAMRECPDPAWRPLLAAKGDDPLVREVLRAIDTKQPPPGGCL